MTVADSRCYIFDALQGSAVGSLSWLNYDVFNTVALKFATIVKDASNQAIIDTDNILTWFYTGLVSTLPSIVYVYMSSYNCIILILHYI